MLNCIACLMTQDVMREQFQMMALRQQPGAPSLRWRVSAWSWAQRGGRAIAALRPRA
jgi:hypothetical protein